MSVDREGFPAICVLCEREWAALERPDRPIICASCVARSMVLAPPPAARPWRDPLVERGEDVLKKAELFERVCVLFEMGDAADLGEAIGQLVDEFNGPPAPNDPS